MADYMILKRDEQGKFQPVTVVTGDTAADLKEQVRQGYTGPGRYAICRWDNRREFDLGPGPVEVNDPPAE